MNLKKEEEKLLRSAKAEFDYIATPENCAPIVRNHVLGISLTGYTLILLFLAASIFGIYLYTKHEKQHQNPIPTESIAPSTQSQ